MFDHIGLGVSNYAESKAFFLKALQPLGVDIVMEGEHGLGIGPKGKPALWLFETSEKPAPLHLAFTAENHKQVQEFHRAALAAGGKDNGPPELLRRFRHWPRWSQCRSGLPSTRDLSTLLPRW